MGRLTPLQPTTRRSKTRPNPTRLSPSTFHGVTVAISVVGSLYCAVVAVTPNPVDAGPTASETGALVTPAEMPVTWCGPAWPGVQKASAHDPSSVRAKTVGATCVPAAVAIAIERLGGISLARPKRDRGSGRPHHQGEECRGPHGKARAISRGNPGTRRREPVTGARLLDRQAVERRHASGVDLVSVSEERGTRGSSSQCDRNGAASVPAPRGCRIDRRRRPQPQSSRQASVSAGCVVNVSIAGIAGVTATIALPWIEGSLVSVAITD